MRRSRIGIIALILAVCTLLSSCDLSFSDLHKNPISLDELPPFDGENEFVAINGNVPYFTKEELNVSGSYERYSELDSLGRCGVAMACVGLDIMPTKDREDLYVEPSGWVQREYDGLYLYNRCHLIGFQLTGENNNEKNLITGTDYMNKTGMLQFENWVDDYIEDTGNHVLYRVTPIYEGEYDLVAIGVLMEAYSIEDDGEGICFNVFCYNVQPGIVINYYDGTSRRESDPEIPGNSDVEEINTFILNTSSKVIHKPTCSSVSKMSEKNKEEFTGNIQDKVDSGYKACGSCKPLG